MVWLFWASAVLLAYVYAGYPLLLALWSRGRPVHRGVPGHAPSVTVVVAAYDEAFYIRDKIRNALELDYPPDRLQVVVVSDGSDDGTADLARQIADDRLVVAEVRPRAGKANALNVALEHATGEIVVFTDANVFFAPDAVARLAAHFADPACGAVTGRVDLLPLGAANGNAPEEPLGEGAYMRLERLLQACESRIGSVIGTDGAMFAARRRLLEPLPRGVILDDFLIAMRIASAGYAVRFEDDSRGRERVPASVSQEFRRKVRIAAGCFQVLPLLRFLRRPWHRPQLWFCFVSHKLLRWLAVWAMLALLLASAALAAHPFYAAALAAQVACYALALIGWMFPRARRVTAVYVPYYFAALNLAFGVGLWRHALGGQAVTWQRVDRSDSPNA